MFEIETDLSPCGDQPEAIKTLTEGVNRGLTHQVLLGVTGSGKTFTMANVIAQVQKPTLIIAPNKTLAAQLYGELKTLFPRNAVEYFVSYYDYYQPEAYIPQTDTYIQKDSHINEQIDKMRHAATRSLLDREDVIIVASVSCIYGLGSPEAYYDMLLCLETDTVFSREEAVKKLVDIHYERGDLDFFRGRFRVRGDVLDVYPVHEEERAVRINFFGDLVESIQEIDPLTGKAVGRLNRVTIYPATHYVTTVDIRERAIRQIKKELAAQVGHFRDMGKLIEAQRVEERTLFDLEMMAEMGYCHGIENYSRHLTGRAPGEPPPTLLDYFPRDFLVIIDESHITIPQLIGMYRGDRSRKETLVGYGFRLPSALDNRPLRFEEFESRVERSERVLVTTLTKRMAEDLTEYYGELDVKVQYMHSDIKTIERMEIIRDLRLGVFDVLVGINLLREGLDLPEVSLVAILDADKEGFLRSERSLIQTCGRASRNINGTVILYADQITGSMDRAMRESRRRRLIQLEYNRANNITPVSIQKNIENILQSPYEADYVTVPLIGEEEEPYLTPELLDKTVEDLKAGMIDAASRLEFEEAALLRDRIAALEKRGLEVFEG